MSVAQNLPAAKLCQCSVGASNSSNLGLELGLEKIVAPPAMPEGCLSSATSTVRLLRLPVQI